MISTYINPQLHGYEVIHNQLAQTNSAITKANILLLMPVGSYIYDINKGNPLINIKERLTVTEITNGISQCLSPLITAGDILNVVVQQVRLSAFQRIIVAIKITLPNGEDAILNWNQK